MKKIQEKKFWITMAKQWREIPPPMRLWFSEKKIFQKFSQQALRNVRNPKILVLGGTPEMRDLAHGFKNTEVTCVDIDINMILTMRELMKYKKEIDKEIWVKSDWTTMPLSKNYYHLILAEAAFANVKFELWPRFLNHLQKLLRPKGYYIDRIVITELGGWLGKSLDEVFAYTKKHRLNFEELRFLLFHRFWNRKLYRAGDVELHRTIRKFYDKRKKMYKHSDPYIQKLLNQILKYSPLSDCKWYNRPQEICEKYIKRYFRIVDVKCGKGESPSVVSYSPIYLLKRN